MTAINTMNVQYRLDKIAGLRKKQALSVVYDNCRIIDRFEKTLNNVTHPTFHKRRQSDYEESCATDATRVFSTYTYFFNEYINAEELANQCIKDDKVLIEDQEQADKFKKLFYEAIENYYSAPLHFVTKKKKTKINNQTNLFE